MCPRDHLLRPTFVTNQIDAAGGAPELLGVLLEGESLFNDASSIVLFEVWPRRGLGNWVGGPLVGRSTGAPSDREAFHGNLKEIIMFRQPPN